MSGSSRSSAEIRVGLSHPVIDADGHTVEYMPALMDYLAEAGCELNVDGHGGAVDKLMADAFGPATGSWYRADPATRTRDRIIRGPWWAIPAANTRDLATAALPGLMYERLEEMGLDLAVVYGSIGPSFGFLDDEQLRRAACRGVNRYHAEVFGPYRDRLLPAAVIPMHSPAEALDELDVAVGELGMKVALLTGYVKRPIAAVPAEDPVARYAWWLDTFGLDSAYDYTPVWERCRELGVPVTSHAPSIGVGMRQSVSNYMFNHLGHFAEAAEALAKSVIMGGVAVGYPELSWGFLECGVNWAASLCADLISHYEKRNGTAIDNYNPERFDPEEFAALLARYGGPLAAREPSGPLGIGMGAEPVTEADRDEFARSGITGAADITDIFRNQLFFGCEADDALTAVAFNKQLRQLGIAANAMFSSDIGHWDVPDVRDVLAESYELVETGLLSEADFREFVCGSAARFLTRPDPRFFDGTALEGLVP